MQGSNRSKSLRYQTAGIPAMNENVLNSLPKCEISGARKQPEQNRVWLAGRYSWLAGKTTELPGLQCRRSENWESGSWLEKKMLLDSGAEGSVVKPCDKEIPGLWNSCNTENIF